MQIEDVLMSRWKYDDHPELNPAKASLQRVVEFHRKVRAKHAEISADAKLSTLGKKDAIREFVVDHAHEIVRAKKSVAAMQAAIEKRRAALGPAPLDRNDVSAAMVRSDIRKMLATAKPAERARHLLSPDETMIAAILEAPNSLSGISDEDRQRIFAGAVEMAHPGEMARLEAAENAATLLLAAVRVVLNTTSAAADFPDSGTFDSALETAVGSTTALDADIDRQFASVMEAAA